jgi:hypothetical protein
MIFMLRHFQRTILALAVAGAACSASGFALLGPLTTWQVEAIGYNVGNIDIGGPMNLTEEYRWNIRTVTYGFDKTFQDYFGKRGIEEVNKAMDILNSLPPVSKMSSNLVEFPQDTRRFNYQASVLGLYDMKSWVLGMMLEEMGLAYPERYVWTLRNRFVTPAPSTNYFVIMRNFDPVTWNPTPYVNGVLYTYNIVEVGGAGGINYADAREAVVDPLAIPLTSVAGIADANGNLFPGSTYFDAGVYFTGLTRDDVGGLRYLWWKNNANVETLPVDVTAGSGGAWAPVNQAGAGSNAFVNVALRPGVDKINFKLVQFYASFPPITNRYTDSYYTNGVLRKQQVQRGLTLPDIIFAAGDLGVYATPGTPVIYARSGTTGWLPNGVLNTLTNFPGRILSGPGIIPPPVVIAFSSIGPWIQNVFPGSMDEANKANFFGGWAAIDGTTNAPFIFPNGQSVRDLMDQVLNKPPSSSSSPWAIFGGVLNTNAATAGGGGTTTTTP